MRRKGVWEEKNTHTKKKTGSGIAGVLVNKPAVTNKGLSGGNGASVRVFACV